MLEKGYNPQIGKKLILSNMAVAMNTGLETLLKTIDDMQISVVSYDLAIQNQSEASLLKTFRELTEYNKEQLSLILDVELKIQNKYNPTN